MVINIIFFPLDFILKYIKYTILILLNPYFNIKFNKNELIMIEDVHNIYQPLIMMMMSKKIGKEHPYINFLMNEDNKYFDEYINKIRINKENLNIEDLAFASNIINCINNKYIYPLEQITNYKWITEQKIEIDEIMLKLQFLSKNTKFNVSVENDMGLIYGNIDAIDDDIIWKINVGDITQNNYLELATSCALMNINTGNVINLINGEGYIINLPEENKKLYMNILEFYMIRHSIYKDVLKQVLKYPKEFLDEYGKSDDENWNKDFIFAYQCIDLNYEMLDNLNEGAVELAYFTYNHISNTINTEDNSNILDINNDNNNNINDDNYNINDDNYNINDDNYNNNNYNYNDDNYNNNNYNYNYNNNDNNYNYNYNYNYNDGNYNYNNNDNNHDDNFSNDYDDNSIIENKFNYNNFYNLNNINTSTILINSL